MEFQSVVNKRKMIRSFQDREIPHEILESILRNMFKGPSAGFSQGIEVIVLRTPESREMFHQQWGTKNERQKQFKRWPNMENAPIILIVCSHKEAYLERYAAPDKGWTDKDEDRWPVPYWHIDAGMAALLALLTVVDHQLGAVFTGCKDLDYVRSSFSIPDEYTPIGAISIGYPMTDDPQSPSLKRGRRPLDEIVHFDNWKKS